MSLVFQSDDDDSSSTVPSVEDREDEEDRKGREDKEEIEDALQSELGHSVADLEVVKQNFVPSVLFNKAVEQLGNSNEKITIRFKPIGSTPSITPEIFTITASQTVSTIIKFLIKRLRLRSNVIYLYIQNSFQPNPDECLGDLYKMFKSNNELVVGYCHTIAFG